MARRCGRLGRALRNDRAVRRAVQGALSPTPSPPVLRRHHNTMHMIDELVSGMAQAAAMDGTLVAAAARRLTRARDWNHPTQEWYRECLAVAGQAAEILAASASCQLSLLARAKSVSGTCLIAIDMHDIARWDGKPGA